MSCARGCQPVWLIEDIWNRHLLSGSPLVPLGHPWGLEILCNLDGSLSPHPRAHLVDQRFRPNLPIDPVMDVLQTFVKGNCILLNSEKSNLEHLNNVTFLIRAVINSDGKVGNQYKKFHCVAATFYAKSSPPSQN